MDETEKLYELRNILGQEEDAEDSILLTYLEQAKAAILYRMNQYMTDEEYEESEVPKRYVQKQLQIAAFLVNKRGAEGETQHIENGIHRNYEDADIPPSMLRGITPFVGIPR